MTARLFLFEARRMARHPLVWGMTALVVAVQAYLTRDQAPHWGIDPVHATGLSTCLAGAVLVVAGLAVSRDGRHGMPESLGALPGRAEHRTRAVLLAAPLVAGVAAAVAMSGYMAIRLASGPAAGRLDPWEPLTAVAVAALAATLGAAVGRWLRRLIAGPLVVAVLGYLIFTTDRYEGSAWLLPVMQFHRADWPDRPSAVHLAYVVALAVLFAGIALLRHRVRPGPSVAVVAALAVAAPTGAAAAAEPPPPRPRPGTFTAADVDPRVRERYFGPGARRCSVRHGITYCAYRGYEAWVPLWEQAVRPAADALPPAVRARLPRVEQTSFTWYYGEDSKTRLRPSMTWGPQDQRTLLAVSLALWATGLSIPGGSAERTGCDASGQARTLVALWIIGQVAPPEPPRMYVVDDGFGVEYLVRWGAPEIGYAKRLLADRRARERVHAHWDTLMRPGTTVEQALPLLGLKPAYHLPPTTGTPCP
ncbi:hypothetical protein MF672_006460 [Actinomadura sp. ATCC 31491]|uniref:ABC transporter permease n=1 Tax=Actinomadura luzonensis TaxID=2805427 RepID=A0ABT0FNG5_9ACTN|nr:hypothetical protein [Actinomadura luzonensis]MCK2213436.1 hypothetical protein [Actinomadura luzonensis]